jgi:hypothetical protein
MAFARGEVGERHLVPSAYLWIQMVNLAREAVRRQPFDHRVRVKKRSVNPVGRRAKDSMKTNRVRHRLLLNGMSCRCCVARHARIHQLYRRRLPQKFIGAAISP